MKQWPLHLACLGSISWLAGLIYRNVSFYIQTIFLLFTFTLVLLKIWNMSGGLSENRVTKWKDDWISGTVAYLKQGWALQTFVHQQNNNTNSRIFQLSNKIPKPIIDFKKYHRIPIPIMHLCITIPCNSNFTTILTLQPILPVILIASVMENGSKLILWQSLFYTEVFRDISRIQRVSIPFISTGWFSCCKPHKLSNLHHINSRTTPSVINLVGVRFAVDMLHCISVLVMTSKYREHKILIFNFVDKHVCCFGWRGYVAWVAMDIFLWVAVHMLRFLETKWR